MYWRLEGEADTQQKIEDMIIIVFECAEGIIECQADTECVGEHIVTADANAEGECAI